jgi:hypothetical protein
MKGYLPTDKHQAWMRVPIKWPMNWLKQRVVILQISILLPAVVGFVLW